MRHRKIAVIGVASGYGAGDRGCQDGPEVLRTIEILKDLDRTGNDFHWDETICLTQQPEPDPMTAVRDISQRLALSVTDHLETGDFPLVIGGDHSCAIGTWSGVRAHLNATEGADARLGLIWIDAHMDSHTPRTSPSQYIHGMALACLLGYGEPLLAEIACAAPKLLPRNVCLIGVRSFEWGEANLLSSLGVRIYFMEEVHRRGMNAVLDEARRHVSQASFGYGISIDLDALDPREEPGVGTPVPNGLLRKEVTEALACIHSDQQLLAFEIVEYNPYRDLHFTTAQAVHDLCRSLILSQS
ncbi:arginase [Sulfuricella sp. T08]|uniref:arginase n=1 Tax=Sulfuricella sp. T08 TaxID=1632857 RepID=UPI0006179F62|nr:arginase [Sulfuricella sp. T08]GAO37815.1 arginase [Sulfuricella sp. T08]